jgi:GT2 family glycosyltransferase
MIDVLIPVLDRPHKVEPLLENLLSSTAIPLRVLFLCSTGDQAELEAVRKTGAFYEVLAHPPVGGQYAKKINLGFAATYHDWLLVGADDVIFHHGWAEQALEAAGERLHVVATNDRANYFVRQGLLATHSLLRRSYIEEEGGSLDGPGIVYHEGYSHNFVDCELSVLARQRGVFVYARNAILEHRHPAFGKAPQDHVYELGFRDFYTDRDLFIKRLSIYPRDPLVRRFLHAVRDHRRAEVRARSRARQKRPR